MILLCCHFVVSPAFASKRVAQKMKKTRIEDILFITNSLSSHGRRSLKHKSSAKQINSIKQGSIGFGLLLWSPFFTDHICFLDTPGCLKLVRSQCHDPLTAIGPIHLTPFTPGPDSLTCHRKPYGPYKRIGLCLGLFAHTLAITILSIRT